MIQLLPSSRVEENKMIDAMICTAKLLNYDIEHEIQEELIILTFQKNKNKIILKSFNYYGDIELTDLFAIEYHVPTAKFQNGKMVKCEVCSKISAVHTYMSLIKMVTEWLQ